MRPLVVLTLLAPSAGQPPDTWFIFVDDLHIRFINTGHLRGTLRQFAAEVLTDGAFVSMQVSGPTDGALGFTDDRDRLSARLKQLTGNGLREGDAPPSEMAMRLSLSMTKLRDALTDLVWREGRPSSMLVVSDGFFESAAYRAQFQAAVRSLLNADTRLFVLRAQDEDGSITERLDRGRVTLTP